MKVPETQTPPTLVDWLRQELHGLDITGVRLVRRIYSLLHDHFCRLFTLHSLNRCCVNCRTPKIDSHFNHCRKENPSDNVVFSNDDIHPDADFPLVPHRCSHDSLCANRRLTFLSSGCELPNEIDSCKSCCCTCTKGPHTDGSLKLDALEILSSGTNAKSDQLRGLIEEFCSRLRTSGCGNCAWAVLSTQAENCCFLKSRTFSGDSPLSGQVSSSVDVRDDADICRCCDKYHGLKANYYSTPERDSVKFYSCCNAHDNKIARANFVTTEGKEEECLSSASSDRERSDTENLPYQDRRVVHENAVNLQVEYSQDSCTLHVKSYPSLISPNDVNKRDGDDGVTKKVTELFGKRSDQLKLRSDIERKSVEFSNVYIISGLPLASSLFARRYKSNLSRNPKLVRPLKFEHDSSESVSVNRPVKEAADDDPTLSVYQRTLLPTELDKEQGNLSRELSPSKCSSDETYCHEFEFQGYFSFLESPPKGESEPSSEDQRLEIHTASVKNAQGTVSESFAASSQSVDGEADIQNTDNLTSSRCKFVPIFGRNNNSLLRTLAFESLVKSEGAKMDEQVTSVIADFTPSQYSDRSPNVLLGDVCNDIPKSFSVLPEQLALNTLSAVSNGSSLNCVTQFASSLTTAQPASLPHANNLAITLPLNNTLVSASSLSHSSNLVASLPHSNNFATAAALVSYYSGLTSSGAARNKTDGVDDISDGPGLEIHSRLLSERNQSDQHFSSDNDDVSKNLQFPVVTDNTFSSSGGSCKNLRNSLISDNIFDSALKENELQLQVLLHEHQLNQQNSIGHQEKLQSVQSECGIEGLQQNLASLCLDSKHDAASLKTQDPNTGNMNASGLLGLPNVGGSLSWLKKERATAKSNMTVHGFDGTLEQHSKPAWPCLSSNFSECFSLFPQHDINRSFALGSQQNANIYSSIAAPHLQPSLNNLQQPSIWSTCPASKTDQMNNTEDVFASLDLQRIWKTALPDNSQHPQDSVRDNDNPWGSYADKSASTVGPCSTVIGETKNSQVANSAALPSWELKGIEQYRGVTRAASRTERLLAEESVLSGPGGVQAVLQHSQLSDFSSVVPRRVNITPKTTEYFKPIVAEAVIASVPPQENLLTSPRTHFRPIKSNEETNSNGSLTTLPSTNVPLELPYRRSNSGTLFLDAASDGSPEKYMVYKDNKLDTSSHYPKPECSLIPKFKVVKNEKFCQTDESDNKISQQESDDDSDVFSFQQSDLVRSTELWLPNRQLAETWEYSNDNSNVANSEWLNQAVLSDACESLPDVGVEKKSFNAPMISEKWSEDCSPDKALCKSVLGSVLDTPTISVHYGSSESQPRVLDTPAAAAIWSNTAAPATNAVQEDGPDKRINDAIRAIWQKTPEKIPDWSMNTSRNAIDRQIPKEWLKEQSVCLTDPDYGKIDCSMFFQEQDCNPEEAWSSGDDVAPAQEKTYHPPKVMDNDKWLQTELENESLNSWCRKLEERVTCNYTSIWAKEGASQVKWSDTARNQEPFLPSDWSTSWMQAATNENLEDMLELYKAQAWEQTIGKTDCENTRIDEETQQDTDKQILPGHLEELEELDPCWQLDDGFAWDPFAGNTPRKILPYQSGQQSETDDESDSSCSDIMLVQNEDGTTAVVQVEYFDDEYLNNIYADTEDKNATELGTTAPLSVLKERSLPPWRRPCSYFMDGTCRRKHCKFSHDLSTITCRFWQGGSCLKGSECPFLHGIPEPIPRRRNRSEGDSRELKHGGRGGKQRHRFSSFELTSETDFPSLGSVGSDSKDSDKAPSVASSVASSATLQRKKTKYTPITTTILQSNRRDSSSGGRTRRRRHTHSARRSSPDRSLTLRNSASFVRCPTLNRRSSDESVTALRPGMLITEQSDCSASEQHMDISCKKQAKGRKYVVTVSKAKTHRFRGKKTGPGERSSRRSEGTVSDG